jgi:hypothetical protein
MDEKINVSDVFDGNVARGLLIESHACYFAWTQRNRRRLHQTQ